MNPLDDNPIFALAANLVNQTDRHIFLTGKAGTGKTTFLKYIKEHSPKKSVVVAPTGIAAINCGGVTIHSFFQLPFTPFIPVPQKQAETESLSDAYSLLQNLRLHQEKRELFEEIELLIIDEISMVRCDVLDAIDTVLRHIRKRSHVPFGGVQMIYIGDLFQLPPVVQEQEWSILQHFYRTPFFFHAKILERAAPLTIELQKIYRQQDPVFIDLLNRVRDNVTTQEDLALLNRSHGVILKAQDDEAVITLTSHNYLADRINAEELEKLPGNAFQFTGTVDGDFPAKSYPTEKELWLKEGTQIMFIKNDVQKERRYFNGKLGRVVSIDTDAGKVQVEFPGEAEHFTLEKEIWRNVRYVYNRNEQRIEEEELGQFSQYPIRLAWAITIHKSQGLTFRKVMVDAAQSFSAGQVYVALSRCTSLEGLALKSPITPRSIRTDERILGFMQQRATTEALEHIYQQEKHQYLYNTLIKAFTWTAVSNHLELIHLSLESKYIPNQQEALELLRSLNAWLEENIKVSQNFQKHLYGWMREASVANDYTYVYQRVKDAATYFSGKLKEEVIGTIDRHIQSMHKMKKVRKHRKEVQLLLRAIVLQEKAMLQSCELLSLSDLKQPITR
ncbi:MAG TPA: AAA family ATPase [Ohtaekwangia sp.]|uniref:ATP-dependent DNA helicase n=1 Tax=Ohtaekwangia sp. TaxID=2066019 RepID=UPI002F928532